MPKYGTSIGCLFCSHSYFLDVIPTLTYQKHPNKQKTFHRLGYDEVKYSIGVSKKVPRMFLGKMPKIAFLKHFHALNILGT